MDRYINICIVFIYILYGFLFCIIVIEIFSMVEMYVFGLFRDLVYFINGKWFLKKEMKYVKIDL